MGLFRKKQDAPLWCVSGSETAKVYVYDGMPLKNVKDGSTIDLTARFDTVSMTSTATGGTWTNAEGDGYAVAYKGKLIGFATYGQKFLREAAEAGFTVSLKAKRSGEYMPGIPRVVLLVPPYDEGREAWKRRK